MRLPQSKYVLCHQGSISGDAFPYRQLCPNIQAVPQPAAAVDHASHIGSISHLRPTATLLHPPRIQSTPQAELEQESYILPKPSAASWPCHIEHIAKRGPHPAEVCHSLLGPGYLYVPSSDSILHGPGSIAQAGRHQYIFLVSAWACCLRVLSRHSLFVCCHPIARVSTPPGRVSPVPVSVSIQVAG